MKLHVSPFGRSRSCPRSLPNGCAELPSYAPVARLISVTLFFSPVQSISRHPIIQSRSIRSHHILPTTIFHAHLCQPRCSDRKVEIRRGHVRPRLARFPFSQQMYANNRNSPEVAPKREKVPGLSVPSFETLKSAVRTDKLRRSDLLAITIGSVPALPKSLRSKPSTSSLTPERVADKRWATALPDPSSLKGRLQPPSRPPIGLRLSRQLKVLTLARPGESHINHPSKPVPRERR